MVELSGDVGVAAVEEDGVDMETDLEGEGEEGYCWR